jgi:hypothetical protein
MVGVSFSQFDKEVKAKHFPPTLKKPKYLHCAEVFGYSSWTNNIRIALLNVHSIN